MLLWHGTRGENLIGILQTGFRIAPADSKRTGTMFGEGIYFADMFNKSYQYSNTSNYHMYNRSIKNMKPAKKYMFLCEVALGKMKKLLNAKPITDIPNQEYQSVMGYGRTGPDSRGTIYMPNGCGVPLGRLETKTVPDIPMNKQEGWGLQHNEYVIYNTSQVRIRYILELRQI